MFKWEYPLCEKVICLSDFTLASRRPMPRWSLSSSNPGMDYVSKLNLYREAGVREYWICDPQQRRVLAYVFDSEAVMQTYPFSTPAPSAVFPGFEFDFDQVMAGM